jgi:cysteine desulfurase
VASAIEHEAVLVTLKALARRGWRTTLLPVDASGIVEPGALAAALADDTAIVSVMHANNEIGTVQPIAELARLAHARGAVFHSDAVQSIGKIAVDVAALGVDLLSLSAHKFNGPKGAGALWIKRGTRATAILTGGKQERARRAGTENVPGIVGLGRAAAVCQREMADEARRLGQLRDRLLAGLQAGLEHVTVNGSLEHRLPHNLHVSFPGVDGESLLVGISDIAVSSSSACASSSGAPSHVLGAIMRGEPVPSASIRFGLGRFTTAEEIDYAIDRFVAVVRHLKNMAPV